MSAHNLGVLSVIVGVVALFIEVFVHWGDWDWRVKKAE